MDITKDEFRDWWNNEVTKAVIKELTSQRNDLTEELLAGKTLSGEAGMTAQLTARVVGEIAGLDYIINREFLHRDD